MSTSSVFGGSVFGAVPFAGMLPVNAPTNPLVSFVDPTLVQLFPDDSAFSDIDATRVMILA